MQGLSESGLRAQGIQAKSMLDLNNISVWDFFDNVSKSDTDDPLHRNSRFGGSLGMAVSVRMHSDSMRSKPKSVGKVHTD